MITQTRFYKHHTFQLLPNQTLAKVHKHKWLHSKVYCLKENKLDILILGGTGRIGTAAAIHLLNTQLPHKIIDNQQQLQITLAGRVEQRGTKAVEEVRRELQRNCNGGVEFKKLDWRNQKELKKSLQGKFAVVHTAGPYLNQTPIVLQEAIKCKVPCYVDVADPVEYLDNALLMHQEAEKSGTTAVLSAGAFPGLSNLLATQCASKLKPEKVQHVDFYYFTAGLGGSGTVNLFITNQGFGEDVPVYRQGEYRPSQIAGLQSQQVDFWFDEEDISKQKVGTRTVWAWPFPESYTVGKNLDIQGDSNVKMGTAPDLWNVILGQMCQTIPRDWWKVDTFSQFLANFSWPMVALTDKFVGETHSIRVDVTDVEGRTVSAIQAHQSFRRCVGQSCAEFLIEIMRQKMMSEDKNSGFRSGVFLPEMFLASEDLRQNVLKRMTSTPDTISYRLKEDVRAQLPFDR